jgi:hypothetical protein
MFVGSAVSYLGCCCSRHQRIWVLLSHSQLTCLRVCLVFWDCNPDGERGESLLSPVLGGGGGPGPPPPPPPGRRTKNGTKNVSSNSRPFGSDASGPMSRCRYLGPIWIVFMGSINRTRPTAHLRHCTALLRKTIITFICMHACMMHLDGN